MGSYINHVDRFLEILDLPPSPLLWTMLLNRTYVVIWTFGKPPAMSTWFMNDPLHESNASFQGGPEVGVSYTLGGYHLSLQWWEYVFIRVVVHLKMSYLMHIEFQLPLG